jgi:hypothetical protein
VFSWADIEFTTIIIPLVVNVNNGKNPFWRFYLWTQNGAKNKFQKGKPRRSCSNFLTRPGGSSWGGSRGGKVAVVD